MCIILILQRHDFFKSASYWTGATAAKLSSVVTPVKCECYIMGRVIEVLLSCYLVLLSDSKTRYQDSCTSIAWHIFSFSMTMILKKKKKKKKPWENGGMEEVAFVTPHQLSSCVATFIYYFASRLVVNKPLIFGQPLLEYWQYGPYKAVSVTPGLGTRAQHCLLHASKVFSKCISL